MLPRLVRLQSTWTWRAFAASAICAVGFLILPTFHSVAQSQETTEPSTDKPVAIQAGGGVQKKAGNPVTAKAATGPGQPADSPIGPRSPKVRAPSVEYLPKPTTEEQRIVLTLEEMTTCDFEDVPLHEAVQQLGKQHKINVVFMMDAKIARETRVSLRVRDVTLRNTLKLILQLPLMGYVVADEVLKIVPLEVLNRQTVTRIYPVQDLIGPAEDFESLILAIQQSVARGSWSTPEDLKSGVLPASHSPVKSDYDHLVGGISQVPASGSLVIHHNQLVHQEILQLLRGLREAKLIPAAE